MKSKYRFPTLAIHAGEDKDSPLGAVTTPIFQTSTFAFKNTEEVKEFQKGDTSKYLYTRYGNPSLKVVEEKVAALEGGEAALVVSSGMAAVSTLALTLVSGGEGVKSTAQIMEMARDLSRNRADLYEIAVWQDGVHVVDGKHLYYFQAVHQESDVVPENVDAIRALMELEKDGHRSMEKTDRAMHIGLAK